MKIFSNRIGIPTVLFWIIVITLSIMSPPRLYSRICVTISQVQFAAAMSYITINDEGFVETMGYGTYIAENYLEENYPSVYYFGKRLDQVDDMGPIKYIMSTGSGYIPAFMLGIHIPLTIFFLIVGSYLSKTTASDFKRFLQNIFKATVPVGYLLLVIVLLKLSFFPTWIKLVAGVVVLLVYMMVVTVIHLTIIRKRPPRQIEDVDDKHKCNYAMLSDNNNNTNMIRSIGLIMLILFAPAAVIMLLKVKSAVTWYSQNMILLIIFELISILGLSIILHTNDKYPSKIGDANCSS